MAIQFFITKRYIQSKKDSRFVSLISVIAILGIAVGVAVLIITLTVLDGFEKTVTQKIIDFNSHIKITGFGDRNLADYHKVIPDIERKCNPYLESISPFVQKQAIISSKNFAEVVNIIGIIPNNNNFQIKKFLIKGDYSFDTLDGYPAVLIGKKLADKLFLDIGDKIVIYSLRNEKAPSVDNPPLIEQFKIQGIFESGMAEYDDINIYIDLNIAQNIFELNDKISGYNIRINNISIADTLSNQLNEFLGYPYYARSIFIEYWNLFTWIDFQKKPIPIILGLIIIVAVFNVISILLMIVLERTKAVGILKSIGAVKKQIVRIFIYQGIYLSLIGIILGNLIALAISIIQLKFNLISLPDDIYFISNVPIIIEWQNYALISGITFLLCLLSSFLPSYIASKINPITAIRFE
ncbi:MAG: ABC transporter permease [Ignavibacteriales bacterium]|nr:ABC transporter permease [Ignavibacteriales bacterium]